GAARASPVVHQRVPVYRLTAAGSRRPGISARAYQSREVVMQNRPSTLPWLSQPLTRRDLLQRSAFGIGALGLCGLFGDDHLRAAPTASPGSRAEKLPHFPGRAKRVIHFFLNGGPSHVDTFDDKPALAKHAGKPLQVTLPTERKTGAAFP